ncbi:hypothetical protein ACFLZ3_05510 [Candidatus Omnitrophota bacterium]
MIIACALVLFSVDFVWADTKAVSVRGDSLQKSVKPLGKVTQAPVLTPSIRGTSPRVSTPKSIKPINLRIRIPKQNVIIKPIKLNTRAIQSKLISIKPIKLSQAKGIKPIAISKGIAGAKRIRVPLLKNAPLKLTSPIVSQKSITPRLQIAPKAPKMRVLPKQIAPIKTSIPRLPVKNQGKGQSIQIGQLKFGKGILQSALKIPPLKLPKQGPYVPKAPLKQRQRPIDPINQRARRNNARNTNRTNNHTPVKSRTSNAPVTATPLVLGMLGHFPLSFKQKLRRILSDISRRRSNGIGYLFSARSPNITGMNGCNLLAFVHQFGQEEILSGVLSHKNPVSKDDYGFFCFYKANIKR